MYSGIDEQSQIEASSTSEPGSVMEWFVHPPYWGVWGTGAAFIAVLAGMYYVGKMTAPAEQSVAAAPAESRPVEYFPQRRPTVTPEEEAPQVSVKSLREQQAEAEDEKAEEEAEDEAPLPGTSRVAPSGAILPKTVLARPPTALPPTSPFPTPMEPEPTPTPPAPTPEPRIVIPAEPAPEPRRQVVPTPKAPEPRIVIPAPPRERGKMSIYFDADSTTYDRRGRRLPLRVEVYVNGVKQIESNDPEKREFQIDRLAAGTHDIEIVPYVDNLPAEPRRDRVRIRPHEDRKFKAVLRRSDGVARISKFQQRD
jgi:hypothetical protein